jgi:hypothetical protein
MAEPETSRKPEGEETRRGKKTGDKAVRKIRYLRN